LPAEGRAVESPTHSPSPSRLPSQGPETGAGPAWDRASKGSTGNGMPPAVGGWTAGRAAGVPRGLIL